MLFKSAVALLAGFLVLDCASHYTYKYHPYENLITIVAELNRHLDYDVYRFGYPQDVSGQNVFKASIVRLNNYQALNPGVFSDVILFALARAYERIGAYDDALKFYSQVVADTGSELQKEAERTIPLIEQFKESTSCPENVHDLEMFVFLMEERIRKAKALEIECKDSHYFYLARMERERMTVEWGLLLKSLRMLIPSGTEKAVSAMEQIIKENKESSHYYRHKLRLADFLFEIAKEYVELNPPFTARFNLNEWEALVKRAMVLYFEVSRADGYEEKLEAKSAFNTINSFSRKIRSRAQ